MIKESKKHLKAVNQGYFEHGVFAIKQGIYIIGIGAASIIHGIIPAWFPFYAPRHIISLSNMIKKRNVPGESE